MIVNRRYVMILQTESWREVGNELLQVSPAGDGTGLTVELTRQEEDFLLTAGGPEGPGQALVAMLLEARGASGQIPGRIDHTYDTETRTFRS